MKKIITAFVFCFLCGKCFSQAGEWTWIHGDSAINVGAVWGVQGVPDPANTPRSFYEATPWTDLDGNFWLYDGNLWKYEPLINMWTWMKGNGPLADPGDYGIQGVPAITNRPRPRSLGAASWTDLNGNLWLYGGESSGPYNDLWKYEISTNIWTWMHGSSVVNAPAVYGTQGIPSPFNTPGSRYECAANWVDSNGDLWLFGGFKGGGSYNDLWKYTISTNEWAWMKGADTVNQTGNYGVIGVEDPANVPCARLSYSNLKDAQGNFWIFGGVFWQGPPIQMIYNLNDMWRFNPLTNNFTWMSGSNLADDSGSYEALCAASLNNLPVSRFESRANWVDNCGNFWIYGGAFFFPLDFTYQDLWFFDPVTLEWDLVNGNALTFQNPVYGNLGISNSLNTPGGRMGAIGWRSNCYLYLFGGDLQDFNMNSRHKNDLWKFSIDTTCITTCSTPGLSFCLPVGITGPEQNASCLVFPNPSASILSILFEASSNQLIELRLYNTVGKQIYFSNEEITKGKFEKEINVEKLSGGIYFLQLKTEEGNINRKVMVNH